MKTFIIVFIALAAVAASSRVAASSCGSVPAAPSCGSVPAAPVASLKLGTLLKSCIITVVKQIIQLLSTELLALVPGNTPVPVPALLAALKALPSATVFTLLAAIIAQLGLPLPGILGILPKIVANTLINVPNLLSVLLKSLPPKCPTVAFATLLSLLGAYLTQLLPEVLANLLNSLS